MTNYSQILILYMPFRHWVILNTDTSLGYTKTLPLTWRSQASISLESPGVVSATFKRNPAPHQGKDRARDEKITSLNLCVHSAWSLIPLNFCEPILSSFTLKLVRVGLPMVAQWQRILLQMQEMQETPVQSLGWEDFLEEEMATHSSMLAWRISQTEEPGGLQPIRSQSVRHDWATEHTHHDWATEHTHHTRAWASLACKWKHPDRYLQLRASPILQPFHLLFQVWNWQVILGQPICNFLCQCT